MPALLNGLWRERCTSFRSSPNSMTLILNIIHGTGIPSLVPTIYFGIFLAAKGLQELMYASTAERYLANHLRWSAAHHWLIIICWWPAWPRYESKDDAYLHQRRLQWQVASTLKPINVSCKLACIASVIMNHCVLRMRFGLGIARASHLKTISVSTLKRFYLAPLDLVMAMALHWFLMIAVRKICWPSLRYFEAAKDEDDDWSIAVVCPIAC